MGLFQSEEDNEMFNLEKEQKAGIAELILGVEQGELEVLEDESLDTIIQRLTVENIEKTVDELVGSLKEIDASDRDIVEAMHVNLGFNLREAKEVFLESKSRLHLK